MDKSMIKLYLLISASIFLGDMATKWLIIDRMLLHDSIDLIPNFLSFTYVQNRGVAFGMLRTLDGAWKLPFLSSVAILAIGLILYYAWKAPSQNKLLHWALALVLGGIFGNLCDRLING